MASPHTVSPSERGVIALRVHIPLACFRRPHAREYWETFPVAPPSTVYGMLLSLVGEEDRLQHQGARIAVGRLRSSEVSRVLRTFYRWKESDILSGKNRSPDWQELLSDVRLAVWLTDGDNEPAAAEKGTLRARVERAQADPSSVDRFGGLSLGESTHMVDAIWPLAQRPPSSDVGELLEVLRPNPRGEFSLPVWPDHVGSAGTRWGRFALEEAPEGWSPEASCWTEVLPPS